MKHLTDIYEGIFDDDFDAMPEQDALLYELLRNSTRVQVPHSFGILCNIKTASDILKKVGKKVNVAKFNIESIKEDEILIILSHPKHGYASLAGIVKTQIGYGHIGLTPRYWSSVKLEEFISTLTSMMVNSKGAYLCKDKNNVIRIMQTKK